MSEDKVTRINVGGHATGIIGLGPIIEEVAKEFKSRTDDEIKDELLNRLSRKNYINVAEIEFRNAVDFQIGDRVFGADSGKPISHRT